MMSDEMKATLVFQEKLEEEQTGQSIEQRRQAADEAFREFIEQEAA